jgi:hypothetical protein
VLYSGEKYQTILREGIPGKGMRITPIYPHLNMVHVEDYGEGGREIGSETT